MKDRAVRLSMEKADAIIEMVTWFSEIPRAIHKNSVSAAGDVVYENGWSDSESVASRLAFRTALECARHQWDLYASDTDSKMRGLIIAVTPHPKRSE
ncbi:MAG: hypothetical protein NXI24_15900 [bacterium]|nr:hypothetical protein [bacterium]